MQNYAGCAFNLVEFEEKTLAYYTDSNTSKLVMNNSESGNLIEQMRQTIDKLQNPFTDLNHWI